MHVPFHSATSTRGETAPEPATARYTSLLGAFSRTPNTMNSLNHHSSVEFPPTSVGTMVDTHLPPELAEIMLVSPTINRWGNGHHPGALTHMLKSVQERFDAEDISDRAAVLLADGTEGADVHHLRAANLSHAASGVRRPAPTYILTQEGQKRVAAEVVRRTGLPLDIVNAVLVHTGYANNRAKIDAVLAAQVLSGRGCLRAINVLGLDDDTMVPAVYNRLLPEALPPGTEEMPNSQVLIHDDAMRESMFEKHRNVIQPFFEHLGSTVGQVRQRIGELRFTQTHKDMMNQALRKARAGEVAQFQVTHDDGPDLDAHAQVVAACPTKHGIPDYRTVEIAQAHLDQQFPGQELPLQSVISGSSKPFAFQTSPTNVDSAALARRFDETTARWPWWYISDLSISRRNPLRTVDAHYRADNELLPTLLHIMSRASGKMYAYVSGIAAQVSHHRSRTGYRPEIYEQAAASLVGNVAATESADRLQIDPRGTPRVDKVEQDYKVPEAKTMSVYRQMKELSDICQRHIQRLVSLNGKREENGDQHHAKLLRQYRQISDIVRAKLADFDEEKFHKHLSVEIRDQVNFYSSVLDAYPQILRAVQDIIRDGKYPVQLFLPSNNRVSVPIYSATVLASHS